jgi:hypothetical protein
MRDDLYAAGDVVSIRFGGVLRHYGVVTSRGTVICKSRLHGGVVEQSLGTPSPPAAVFACMAATAILTDTMSSCVHGGISAKGTTCSVPIAAISSVTPTGGSQPRCKWPLPQRVR